MRLWVTLADGTEGEIKTSSPIVAASLRAEAPALVRGEVLGDLVEVIEDGKKKL